MRIQPASVGPIVGESGPHHVRLLLRGQPERFADETKPDAGMVRWRRVGESAWSPPVRFRLNRNFDFTGLVVITDLLPGTHYEYQCGCLPAPWHDQPLDWSGASSGTFATAPASDRAPVSLYLGACCYRFFNRDLDNLDDRADKAFRSMLAREAEDGPVDMVLFAGDQVYADPLHRWGDLDMQEDFFRLYRSAFSQPWLARLLASRSTFMILDDHEIENNWPAAASSIDRFGKYPAALKAYQVYQASHSPALELDDSGRFPARDPDHFWYRFQRGCADFFVMDVRNERQLSGSEQDRRMISERQEDALADWLRQDPERIKCLVSPVVMFPDQRPLLAGQDAWEGFVAQRTRLLEVARAAGNRRLLVLSGDVHAALAARLRCQSAAGAELVWYNLISSGLFWPTALNAFRWHDWALAAEGALATTGTQAAYRWEAASRLFSRDAFARLDLSESGWRFRVFDRKGNPVPEAGAAAEWDVS